MEYVAGEVDREPMLTSSCTRAELTSSSATERYKSRGTPGLG